MFLYSVNSKIKISHNKNLIRIVYTNKERISWYGTISYCRINYRSTYLFTKKNKWEIMERNLTINRLICWTMSKNQNMWSHRTKIIFHPLGSITVFLPELSFFDRKTSEALGTHHLQAWFLNVWDNVPMDIKYVCQKYFTCMCFLGFIRYNKTFIACGFRKYENVFTHEYHIPLGRCPQGIWWYSWVNNFSYFPH